MTCCKFFLNETFSFKFSDNYLIYYVTVKVRSKVNLRFHQPILSLPTTVDKCKDLKKICIGIIRFIILFGLGFRGNI